MLKFISDISISEWLMILIVLMVTWLLWEYLSIPKNYPPGPWGLPIIGYLRFLGSKPHVTLDNLRKTYGDIFSIRLVNLKVVVLSSYQVLTEALVKNADAFSARSLKIAPHTLRVNAENQPNYLGIIMNNGESWSAVRRFSLTTLRNFGFAKSSLQQSIMEEVQRMIEIIQAKEGKPMLLSDLIQKGITNIICTLMSGHRMEYDDAIFNELISLTREQVTAIGVGNIDTLLPMPLQKMKLLEKLGRRTSDAPIRKMMKILSDIVEKYAKEHRPGSQENFIDCWMTELKKKGNPDDSFKLSNLNFLLRDLFIAGSDTTTNSLTWGFLYMAKFPEIQKKIQNEIDEVIGADRSPSLEDQKSMPYTEATLMEVMRIETVVPLSIPHLTTKDSKVGDYVIPKNTLIIPNIYAVHHDPQTFPDPHEFKPERFLDDKQQVKKMEQLIPFSMGKRQCMGESLARMELFLFFTAILQRFTIKKVEGIPLNFDYDYAAISVPKPQNLCVVPR